VRPERFELPTLWFEAKCSIQLSYGRVVRLGKTLSKKADSGKLRVDGVVGYSFKVAHYR